MVQDPLRADQIRIRPSAALPILIYDVNGDLAFKDASVTGGILFKQLAGMTIDHFLLVGKAGLGAAYTTIQAALDAIPADSSATNPYVVFVGPGVYQETVNLVRDGVFIVGYGATLQSAAEATPNGPGAYHTVVIQAALGTIPRNVVIQGLTITNAHDAYACVRLSGAAGSEIGSGGVLLLDCNLKATGTGTRALWATSIDYLTVQGGSMNGCSVSALVYASDCAGVTLDGVRDLPGCQLDYNSAGTIPSVVGSAYQILGCANLAASSTLSPPLQFTLTGAGSLRVVGCSGSKALTMNGNRSLAVQGSALGNLVLNGTTAATLVGSTRGTVTGATATLAEPFQGGVATFSAETTKAVVFDVPHPDTGYHVTLTPLAHPAGGEVPWYTAKATTGFTINFNAAQALDVEWSVGRRM